MSVGKEKVDSGRNKIIPVWFGLVLMQSMKKTVNDFANLFTALMIRIYTSIFRVVISSVQTALSFVGLPAFGFRIRQSKKDHGVSKPWRVVVAKNEVSQYVKTSGFLDEVV